MKDTKVGKLIDATAQRDAIHVAIAPVITAELCDPGEHVGFMEDGRVGTNAKKKIGVIDPFLKDTIGANKRCYLFLYPQTVTGMRHHWEHPSFTDFDGVPASTQSEIDTSRAWLENYVRRVCPYDNERIDGGYGEFMDYVKEGVIYYHGSDCHGAGDVEDARELYKHLSVVLGRTIDQSSFESFQCSC